MIPRRLTLALLAAAWPAAGHPEPAPQLHATYEAYAVGVQVAQLTSGFQLSGRDYRLDMAFHTTGLIGAMFSGRQTSSVQGAWIGDRPEPLRFLGDGVWRGQPRHILIDYQAGQPLIRALVPPNDREREPVSPELQAGSIDSLSALALLMREIGHTGRCEADVKTFDGRRAVIVSARTGPEEQLAPEVRSSFTGRALRCDFEGKLVGGFMLDGDRGEMEQPQHGSAWFAQVVPGGPPLPVRIRFDTRWFGQATMYLTEAGPGPAPAPAR